MKPTIFNPPEFRGAIVGGKIREYQRSIELFEEIFKEQGVYFALAFLYDSQYDRTDIKKMMELLKPNKKELVQ